MLHAIFLVQPVDPLSVVLFCDFTEMDYRVQS